MDKITIPPVTLKAMRTAAEKVYGTQFFDQEIEAAARAMLEAWPGLRLMEEQRSKTIQWVPWRIREWKYRFLHLPLTQEPRHD